LKPSAKKDLGSTGKDPCITKRGKEDGKAEVPAEEGCCHVQKKRRKKHRGSPLGELLGAKKGGPRGSSKFHALGERAL